MIYAFPWTPASAATAGTAAALAMWTLQHLLLCYQFIILITRRWKLLYCVPLDGGRPADDGTEDVEVATRDSCKWWGRRRETRQRWENRKHTRPAVGLFTDTNITHCTVFVYYLFVWETIGYKERRKFENYRLNQCVFLILFLFSYVCLCVCQRVFLSVFRERKVFLLSLSLIYLTYCFYSPFVECSSKVYLLYFGVSFVYLLSLYQLTDLYVKPGKFIFAHFHCHVLTYA